MPRFETPQPIIVAMELSVADVWITASDRTDTIVEVRPGDPSDPAQVRAAETTRVEFTGGRLHIKTPKQRLFGGGRESIDISIELPTGSRIQGESGVGSLKAEGQIGDCTFKLGVGEITLDQTGPLRLATGSGSINVDGAAGETDIATGNGSVRIREIAGPASIKNSNGDTTIGEIAGELRVNSANGRISVDRAAGSVTAKTANGAIRIGEVVRGAIMLESAHGGLEIGIRSGSAAWLDLSSKFGKVRNSMDPTSGPIASDDTVEVRARTGMGDISVHHSTGAVPAAVVYV